MVAKHKGRCVVPFPKRARVGSNGLHRTRARASLEAHPALDEPQLPSPEFQKKLTRLFMRRSDHKALRCPLAAMRNDAIHGGGGLSGEYVFIAATAIVQARKLIVEILKHFTGWNSIRGEKRRRDHKGQCSGRSKGAAAGVVHQAAGGFQDTAQAERPWVNWRSSMAGCPRTPQTGAPAPPRVAPRGSLPDARPSGQGAAWPIGTRRYPLHPVRLWTMF